MLFRAAALAVAVCAAACASAPTTRGAPPDQPVTGATPRDDAALQRALEPCTIKARATYPDAKRRYLAGLPAGHMFYVTVHLSEPPDLKEQPFVRVVRITDGKITGTIANQIVLLRGYKDGDTVSVPESELLDWTITRPDGSEEGNLRGKYIDGIGTSRGPQC